MWTYYSSKFILDDSPRGLNYLSTSDSTMRPLDSTGTHHYVAHMLCMKKVVKYWNYSRDITTLKNAQKRRIYWNKAVARFASVYCLLLLYYPYANMTEVKTWFMIENPFPSLLIFVKVFLIIFFCIKKFTWEIICHQH